MTDQETAITAEKGSDPEDWFTYQDLLEQIKAPLTYKHSEGPWNGTYLPPMTHRSKTFSFVPLSLQVRVIDNIAYWNSADHIRRALQYGWPGVQIPDDPDYLELDMWGEWVGFGRGDKFSFAALTHARDNELGCAYLYPPADGDDPYEAGLHIWTIEEALGQDLDIALLTEFLAWIEAEWDLNRVLYYTPESYDRGFDVAAAAGLRRVDRTTPRPNYVAFEWERP